MIFARKMIVAYKPNERAMSEKMGLTGGNQYAAYGIDGEKLLVVDDRKQFAWIDLHKVEVIKDGFELRESALSHIAVENKTGNEGLQQGTEQIIAKDDRTVATGGNGKAVRTKAGNTEPVGGTMDFTKKLS